MVTGRFKGHPVGVAKALAKLRVRNDVERRCVESLLCALTDEEFADAAKVEVRWYYGARGRQPVEWDSVRLIA